MLDEMERVLPGFSAADCVPFRGDSTRHRVIWNGNEDMASVAGKPARLRFHLLRGEVYSFWVSESRRGESKGFVAAGGPGFDGPTDIVGDLL